MTAETLPAALQMKRLCNLAIYMETRGLGRFVPGNLVTRKRIKILCPKLLQSVFVSITDIL